jgi:hypothetical protein
LVIIIPANIEIGMRQNEIKYYAAKRRSKKKEKRIKTKLARTLSLNHLLIRK